ncbi:hypothetical protein MKX08_003904 [Trichoderma sp. CBMAI-0020]|nr:hypothetical protein MKX08_003904 [Trichoderma sp. CBMAI-0020]
MENAGKKGMYETDVTYLEDKVVSAAFSWLALNLDVPWDDAPEKPSKFAVLDKLVYPLRLSGGYYNARLCQLRPGAAEWVHGSGELLPLYPCVGCTITDGEFSHALNFGKKLHLPADKTKHKLCVAGPNKSYMVWLFRTEKDFAPL